jgi:hypothetical protein
MRLAITLGAIALLGAGSAQATGVRSGLQGTVTRGPISPVCVAEQPCDEPASNVTLLFFRNGRVMGRAVTNGDGRYRVRLPAGVYSVRRPGTVTLGRRLEPDHARVRTGRFVRVDFSIDTGIR